MTTELTTKQFLEQANVKARFEELLGKRAPQFLASVLQVINSNDLLKKASPESVYMAAVTAATLNLPINNNLGFAYIVPFKGQAQFQIGYKGLIQLAQRTGQYKTISVTPVYEGQIVSEDPLNGFEFDWKAKQSDVIIGYAAKIVLINGFEKTLYSPVDSVKAHAKKYSQTYKRDMGLWKDEFDVMAQKTVLKHLISKYGPLSIELQTAVEADQAVIKETGEYIYSDNVIDIDPVAERERKLLLSANSLQDLELICNANPDLDKELVDKRKEELSHVIQVQ